VAEVLVELVIERKVLRELHNALKGYQK
jgi:hypothetical protein